MADDTLRETILRLAKALAQLQPGPLAALRRAAPGGGAAAFWQVYHGLSLTGPSESWEWVAAAFAILTPTGREDGKRAPHDASIPLGSALFAAGVKEQRVARLLNAPFDQRRPMLLRLSRTLAAKDQTLDMCDLGELLLSQAPHQLRRLADKYYAAVADAARKDKADA